jgi:hypothetical protein
MAGFDTSTGSSILKVRYLGTIREYLNNATVFLNRVEKKVQSVSGTSFTIPVHKGRNIASAISLPEGGTLPTAGYQAYDTMTVPNRYMYSTIRVSGPMIAAARDNVGAFVQAIESEVDGVQKDTKKNLNRMLLGDGVDAVMYYLTGASSTGGTVNDGETGVGGVAATGNAFIHLTPGVEYTLQSLDANSSYATLDSALKVTVGAKNANTYTVVAGTTAFSSSLAAGDPFVINGTVSGTTTYAMMGLRGIVSDAEPANLTAGLQGKAVASNPWFKAQMFTNSGTKRPIAFEDMQEAIDTIATTSDYSEDDINLILMNYPLRRAYYKLCIAERRHVNTMKLDGGFEAVDYNGKPLVVDSQCRRNGMFILCMDSLAILRTSDFDWMDKDGSYLSRVSGVDAYEATLFHYGNLAVYTRNCNAWYGDLIEE